MSRSGAWLTILVLAAAGSMFAQRVVSAKAGLVNCVLRPVTVVGSGWLDVGSVDRQLKDGEVLSSDCGGRAEVMLNPGAAR